MRRRILMNAHLPPWISVLASALVLVAQVAAVQGQSTSEPATETAVVPAPAAGFSKEQLEQIVAPIALHPDPLVAQMLMAATYPLEIVEAGRWMKANPGLKDKALEEALKKQEWDASVKSLCGFPDVLKQMDDNLDWTQDLGDAFLSQKTELMDTIQRMRGKAYDSGNLKTTEQQVVTQQPDKIIVVQPANPEVIYVPTYSPTVVYGGWSYPITTPRCIIRRPTAMERWRSPWASCGARQSGAAVIGVGEAVTSISISTARTTSIATRTSTAAGTRSATGPAASNPGSTMPRTGVASITATARRPSNSERIPGPIASRATRREATTAQGQVIPRLASAPAHRRAQAEAAISAPRPATPEVHPATRERPPATRALPPAMAVAIVRTAARAIPAWIGPRAAAAERAVVAE
jgi:hypothetical protein